MRRIHTDPDHLHVTDPGRVQGNVAVAGRDALDPDCSTVTELETRDRRGGLGDTIVKQRLETVPLDRLALIRMRRATGADRPNDVRDILRDGIRRADCLTQATLDAVTDVNLAELWGLRPDGTNPCRHVKKYTGSKRTHLITDEELTRLYAYLDRAYAEGLEHPILTLAVRLQFECAARMCTRPVMAAVDGIAHSAEA